MLVGTVVVIFVSIEAHTGRCLPRGSIPTTGLVDALCALLLIFVRYGAGCEDERR